MIVFCFTFPELYLTLNLVSCPCRLCACRSPRGTSTFTEHRSRTVVVSHPPVPVTCLWGMMPVQQHVTWIALMVTAVVVHPSWWAAHPTAVRVAATVARHYQCTTDNPTTLGTFHWSNLCVFSDFFYLPLSPAPHLQIYFAMQWEVVRAYGLRYEHHVVSTQEDETGTVSKFEWTRYVRFNIIDRLFDWPFSLCFQTVLLYAKQENEEVFHPLHLVPPTLVGLALAVSWRLKIKRKYLKFI